MNAQSTAVKKQENTLVPAVSLRKELGLITQEELASALGIELTTLQTWRMEKRGPAYTKVGKLIFYHRSDVVQWLSENVVRMT